MSVCQTGYKHVSGPCEVNSKLSTGLLKHDQTGQWTTWAKQTNMPKHVSTPPVKHVCKNMTETSSCSKSLIQHFWKQPLANVLTSTQTPRLRSTRRLVTLCHHLPSKQKHARRHYWSHNLLLLNSSMMMSILPLARDRVDEGSNAPTNVPMSHIHHATIAVIHNRNPVWCWLSQASIQHEITSSNL